MRGTPAVFINRHTIDRSIPAPAGNTRQPCWRSGHRPSTPRMREHDTEPPFAIGCSVPSPRMRGTRRPLCAPLSITGPSPAHAGTLVSHHGMELLGGPSPRMRGNTDYEPLSLPSYGPSPRMRGTPIPNHCTASLLRSIPANAGNTPSSATRLPRPAVHPRACGEHHIFSLFEIPCCGPSPRMRGTQVRAAYNYAEFRSIPAHAGNTS